MRMSSTSRAGDTLRTHLLLVFILCTPISCVGFDHCSRCGRLKKSTPSRPFFYRIISGHEVRPDILPWSVLVEQHMGRSRYLCTGAIISKTYILTAAHCVMNQLPPLNCRSALGKPTARCWAHPSVMTASKTGEPRDRQPVADTIPHPRFTLPEYHHDIALVKVRDAFPCTGAGHVTPVCLPVPFYNGYVDKLHVAGFGRSRSRRTKEPIKFRRGVMSMVPTGTCQNHFGYLLEDTIICTLGNHMLQSICVGDSGSSVTTEQDDIWYTLGVASLFGGDDCSPFVPSVFTKTSYYVLWIRSVVPDLPTPDVQRRKRW